MKKIFIFFLFWLSTLSIWCTKIITTPISEKSNIKEEKMIEETEIDMTNKEQVGNIIIKSLKEKDMRTLSKLTSDEWIRFSPYNYIDTDIHITLKKDELEKAINSKTEYMRWTQDWSGFPILMNLNDYIDNFVYDVDFEKLWEKNYDKILQRSNTINNIKDIYTGISTIEYFIPWINPEYEWIDRRELILILKKENNNRKLRAIVHSQRTI